MVSMIILVEICYMYDCATTHEPHKFTQIEGAKDCMSIGLVNNGFILSKLDYIRLRVYLDIAEN